MKRGDGLVEKYVALLQTRGLAKATIGARERELVRFGSWRKARRPRPGLEELDADIVVRYIQGRSAFHSRSTVSSVVSSLRCMGELCLPKIGSADERRGRRGGEHEVEAAITARKGDRTRCRTR